MVLDNLFNNKDLIFIETKGFSMWPFLKEGTKLIIKKVSFLTLKVGDIILYEKDGNKICHRVVRKIVKDAGARLFVRGDNSISSPEEIDEEMFCGKVIGYFNGSKIKNFLGFKSVVFSRTIVLIAPFLSRVNRFAGIFYKKAPKKDKTND